MKLFLESDDMLVKHSPTLASTGELRRSANWKPCPSLPSPEPSPAGSALLPPWLKEDYYLRARALQALGCVCEPPRGLAEMQIMFWEKQGEGFTDVAGLWT